MSQRSVVQEAGFTVELPDGWELEITGGRPDGLGTAASPVQGAPEANPVVHLATFALPPGRGDFGSIAVEAMGPSDVLVCLVEYDAADTGSTLFQSTGVPTISPADFDPSQMQRPIQGQSGCQRFFQEAGRAFCLYVVLGSHARREVLVPLASEVLRTLTIAPR